MSCTDKKIYEKLSDYYSGHLSDKENREVEAHMAQCKDCKESFMLIKMIAGDINADKDYEIDHINSDLLTRYFQDKSSLSTDKIEKISKHLSECRDCAFEYQFLRDMESEMKQSIKAELRQPSLLQRLLSYSWGVVKKPAFAYFLLFITLYPAANWLMKSPSGTGPGFANLTEYSIKELNRATGDISKTYRSPNNSLLWIAIPYYHLREDYHYNYSIKNLDLSTVFSSEIISRYDSKDIIGLIVNTENIPDGSYILELNEVEKENPNEINTYQFSFMILTR